MKGIPHELALSYARQLWRHRWLSVAAAWAICAIGWPIIAFIPLKYESSARVYVNADQLLVPILNGIAVNDDPVRHVEYLQKTLLSRPNLEQVMHLSDLDISSHGQDSPSYREETLQTLAREVVIKSQTSNLITITYRNIDPVVAKNVVNALLTVFSENSTGTNRGEMENAKRFLNLQIQAYEAQLRAAEKRRAEFHEKYMDLLPGLNGAVSRVDEGRAMVAKLALDVSDARSKRDSLQHELESVPKFLSVDAAGPQVIVGGQPINSQSRLEAARAKLDELRSRFTEQHPDVVALRQQIAELEARSVKETPSSKETNTIASSSGRKSEITNSVYEQIKVRLVEAETALTSAERRLQQARTDQEALEEKAHATPGVEAQAQDLDRDYEVKKKSYDELLQRREQTLIAEAADTTADKIQFRIIDAPQIPVVPAAPNQPLLILGIFIVALGAAIAIPIVLLQFDKSFRTVAALRALGLPILGSVSRFSFPGARRRTRFQVATLAASASALFMIFGMLMAISINLYGLGIV
jgi:polysaccharide chain length determinant protein (PEP-CTERM system associated)